MLRAIGVLMVIGAGVFLGGRAALGIRSHVLVLSDLIRILTFIKNEISARNAPLPEILRKVQPSASVLAETFRKIQKKGKEQAIPDAWSECFSKEPEILRQNERQMIAALGNVLGRYDADKQAQELEYTIQVLRESLEKANAGLKNDAKMRLYTGLAAGVFLVIILL